MLNRNKSRFRNNIAKNIVKKSGTVLTKHKVEEVIALFLEFMLLDLIDYKIVSIENFGSFSRGFKKIKDKYSIDFKFHPSYNLMKNSIKRRAIMRKPKKKGKIYGRSN
jgi:nucleoid DNA-binding protein